MSSQYVHRKNLQRFQEKMILFSSNGVYILINNVYVLITSEPNGIQFLSNNDQDYTPELSFSNETHSLVLYLQCERYDHLIHLVL